MSDTESMSERELAEFLTEEVFAPEQPRSVGEALAETPPDDPPPGPPLVQEDEPPPLVVTDTPEQQGLPVPGPPIPPPEPERDDEKDESVLEEGEETEEDEHVSWATRKYGNESQKWAKAAFDMEKHITRLTQEKTEAEGLAAEWYEYAQGVEQSSASQQAAALPMSAQEEMWVEQSVTNPLEFARQAAFAGNFPLYQAVIARVAEENALIAANVGAQVQQEFQQASEQQQTSQPQAQPLPDALGRSFQRLGIDLEKAGPAMSEKISELGEYHPYVQAILTGDDAQRDLAVQAVHDLTRATTLTRRRVRNEDREDSIRREGELRREAAGVVTGAPHTPPPKEDPFLAAMETEWRARRQWGGDDDE